MSFTILWIFSFMGLYLLKDGVWKMWKIKAWDPRSSSRCSRSLRGSVFWCWVWAPHSPSEPQLATPSQGLASQDVAHVTSCDLNSWFFPGSGGRASASPSPKPSWPSWCPTWLLCVRFNYNFGGILFFEQFYFFSKDWCFYSLLGVLQRKKGSNYYFS